MNIAVVGLTHKTAPVEVREKLSIQHAVLPEAIADLKRCTHVREVAVLSTCNRMEIYAVLDDASKGVLEIVQFLTEHAGLPQSYLRRYLFVLLHDDACRHVMRVAGGLDSLVLGEGQILSQVKEAHQNGQKNNGVARLLDRLFKQAITAGKRVRTETNIGTGSMSISSAAVELALEKVEALAGQNIAIIGAGKMSRLLVKHLVSKGADTVAVVNRSAPRAEKLAADFPAANIQVKLLPDLLPTVAAADIVFTSTSSTEPVLDRAKIESCHGGDRALLLIDIAVPRNVAADVSELTYARSYNVDDLKEVVAKNVESRRQMAQEAEILIEEEVRAYTTWVRSLESVPTISSLRDKLESIRAEELEKALSRLGSDFSQKHQKVVEALTRGIVNKILHEPMTELRCQEDDDTRRQTIESLQLLFKLESKV